MLLKVQQQLEFPQAPHHCAAFAWVSRHGKVIFKFISPDLKLFHEIMRSSAAIDGRSHDDDEVGLQEAEHVGLGS